MHHGWKYHLRSLVFEVETIQGKEMQLLLDEWKLKILLDFIFVGELQRATFHDSAVDRRL